MAYRILVTDEVDADGVALLAAEPEFTVDEVPTLPKEELVARIGDYHAFVGRSATRVSAELLRAATRLAVVGRAGVGIDNIAMDIATELGIAVINVPAGNTIAVAELFYGAVIGLLRQIPRADRSMRDGRWDRSDLLGTELKGRTLGIVGLGRIGSEVALRAQAFGMDVVAYDPYIREERFDTLRVRRMTTLDALLSEASILTIHTPLTDETRGMIGAREIARLNHGAMVVNMARGGLVDDTALIEALERKHLSGAVLDVYVTEPLPPAHALRLAPNVVLTPHIGASTAEAQRNVAVEVCRAVRDALLSGELSRSINAAKLGDGRWEDARPVLAFTRQLAAIGRAMLASRDARAIDRIDVTVGDSWRGAREAILASAAQGALMSVVANERLNLINARSLAAARGILLSITDAPMEKTEITLRLTGGAQDITVAGVAPLGAAPRLVRIGAFHVDIQPRGTLLILTNTDVPGVIGRVGTTLGAAGVNIAEYHQARLAQGGEALAAVAVDGAITDDLRHLLLTLPDVRSATVVPLVAG